MGDRSVLEVQRWESLTHKENEIVGVDMKRVCGRKRAKI